MSKVFSAHLDIENQTCIAQKLNLSKEYGKTNIFTDRYQSQVTAAQPILVETQSPKFPVCFSLFYLVTI